MQVPFEVRRQFDVLTSSRRRGEPRLRLIVWLFGEVDLLHKDLPGRAIAKTLARGAVELVADGLDLGHFHRGNVGVRR